VNNNPWPAIIVGIVLVVIGVGAQQSVVRSWRRRESDPTLEEVDRLYYHRQYRRRVRISATFAILGVLIGIGDVLLPQFQQRPIWPTLYFIGVLFLTGWVLLLGVADFMSTAAHGRAEMARARQKRRELERQVVEFKHRNLNGRNGHNSHDEA